MDFSNAFAGRGVVVTGAVGLFGKGLARCFAGAGAKLCLTDRDPSQLDAALAEVGGAEGSFAFAAELTDVASMETLVAEVGRRWGAPDVVVNNAGIYPSGFMLDIDVAEWDRIMDVNLRAPFVLTQCFAKQMIAAGVKGNFINVSSGAARKMRRTVAPYCISKTALDRLTKGWAQELAEFGIRVNALEPGFAAGSTVSHLTDEHIKRAVASIPLKRASTIDDVGPAALFLASDAAGFITGTSLAVDGGNSIGSLDVYQDKKSPL